MTAPRPLGPPLAPASSSLALAGREAGEHARARVGEQPAAVLFTHYGAPWIRGSERVLLDLLAHLDRGRFAPVVWCNSEVFADAARRLDVPVHVSAMPMLLGWDAPRFDVRGYRRLVREAGALIGRYGVRLVHANSAAPNQWLVPAARRANIPLVAHIHAFYGPRDRCVLRVAEASVIVGVSGAVARQFAADGVPDDRLRVIYNGVDPARLGVGDATGLRATLGIAPDKPVVVAVSSLLMGKGLDVLLAAAAALAARGRCPAIVSVGDGGDAAMLRAMAERLGVASQVRFLGERADVGAILRDVADVAVLPSRREAFGLAAAEAGLFGVPCIVSDIPGLREVVAHGETGLHVPPDDPAALADAIERLTTDAALRARMRPAAIARVGARFTVTAMTADFTALYEAQLARGRHEPVPLGQRLAPWWRLGRAWAARRVRRLTTSASA